MESENEYKTQTRNIKGVFNSEHGRKFVIRKLRKFIKSMLRKSLHLILKESKKSELWGSFKNSWNLGKTAGAGPGEPIGAADRAPPLDTK